MTCIENGQRGGDNSRKPLVFILLGYGIFSAFCPVTPAALSAPVNTKTREMFKNYFKTAWRNLRRNKLFSFINIIGLSIGISAALVIYLLVSYDLSFDKSHKDGNRMYRIVCDMDFSGEPFHTSGVPSPMPYAVRKELAGLDEVVPFFTWEEAKASVPEPGKEQPKIFKKQDHIVFADENYFRMIQYQWLAGAPKTSLKEPSQVVLTESKARLYFPKLSPEEIVGKKIYFNDTVVTTVSGIVKDLAYNSDFTSNTFISRATLESTSLRRSDWDNWGSVTSASQLWIKLSKGTTPGQIEKGIDGLLTKYADKKDWDSHSKTVYHLQPLADLHFNHLYGNFHNGDHLAHKPTLYSLLAVAAFLLLLACINFINLTTAQSTQRAKEIGIRKTIGSSRRQLMFQFLSETFYLTLLAALLSILLTPLLLKVFADFIPKGLHFNLADQPGVLLFLVLLVVAVSLLSGLYPAAVLSSYRPVLVLKGQVQGKGNNKAWLRKSLTLAQFVIAQIFIIATLLVSKQIQYSLHKELGFKKDAIVYFHTNYFDPNKSNKQVLLEKVKAIPGVAVASICNDVPSSAGEWISTMEYMNGKEKIATSVNLKYGDANYIRLFQLKLIAGKEPIPGDTARDLVINETYARFLGFRDPREAIGKTLEWSKKKVLIAGVVADFHQKSLHDPIKPLAICSQLNSEAVISVALAPQSPGNGGWKATIDKMRQAWSEVYTDKEFEYNFQDETIAKFYKAEQDIARLLAWATGLAIFISCLGLLGLVIYITNQRTKEIGIRKIVGASITQIITLLSADFLKLIALAFVLAVPVAWWGANKWLDNFAYRTTLSWWVFVAGGLLMMLIAFVILLLRTFRVASANPVNSLRTE